ncbi:MAG TPA: insulinase family protein, partial [Pedobacter sp.]|nr:insulinase family protein [Pedobacter sp.]
MSSTISHDKTIRIGKLKNGFTYYLKNTPDPNVEIHFLVKAGSNQEPHVQIAHLMEHMPMNSTKNFKNAKAYFPERGLRPGADMNASTGDDLTDYWAKIHPDNKELFLDVLKFFRDCAHDVNMDSTNMEDVRSAVFEEGRANQMAPNSVASKRLKLLHWETNYAKKKDIDVLNAIKTFRHQTLQNFYDTWYRANFQGLTIVGNFDIDKTEEIIKKLFSALRPSPNAILTQKSDSNFFKWKNRFTTIKGDNIKRTIEVYIKRPIKIMKTQGDLEFLIITKLYNKMMANRFIRENDNGSISSFKFTPSKYFQNFILDGPDIDVIKSSISGDSISPVQALSKILDENELVRRFGFSEDELKSAKSDLISGPELFDTTSINSKLSSEMADHFVSGTAILNPITHRDLIMALLKNITVTRINGEVKEWIKP